MNRARDRALYEQKLLQDSDEYQALWRQNTLKAPPKAVQPQGYSGFRYECARCGEAIPYPTHYCPAE